MKGPGGALFYHASYQECQRTISLYENLAESDAAARSGPRVAFARVKFDPPGPLLADLFTTNLVLHDTLDAADDMVCGHAGGGGIAQRQSSRRCVGQGGADSVWVK